MNCFKKILLVFDPARNDDATVSLAVSLAGRNHADLTLLSVVEELPPDARIWTKTLPAGELFERVMKDRREQLRSLIESIGAAGIEAETRVVSGTPFLQIIRQVLRDRHDLVMGTVCRTGVAGFFIGNTAETVLTQVDCSVLSVKPERFVTPVTLEDR